MSMKKVMVIGHSWIDHAVQEAGAEVLRSSEEMEPFLKAIEDADLLVVDFTTHDQVGALAAGYALARGKTILAMPTPNNALVREIVYSVNTCADLCNTLNIVKKNPGHLRPWGRPPPGESNA